MKIKPILIEKESRKTYCNNCSEKWKRLYISVWNNKTQNYHFKRILASYCPKCGEIKPIEKED